MILVTLGTQDKEFTRLLKEIDRLIDKGIIKEEVIVQAGYTKYKSDNMTIFDYVSKDEINDYIEQASFIITHGGVGSIVDSLKCDKKVIAVPRLSKYNEHNNDHQLEVLKELGNNNYIYPVYDIEKLEDAIINIDSLVPNKYISDNSKIKNLISDYIDNNRRRSMIETIKSLMKKYHEVIMYLIFGVLTTLVSLVSYFILTSTLLNASVNLEMQIANVISWILSVTFAYFTNRSLVFMSENKNKLKEAVSFYSSRIVTLIMEIVIMFIGVTLLHFNDKLVKVLAQVIVIVSNYIISKLIVFKKK